VFQQKLYLVSSYETHEVIEMRWSIVIAVAVLGVLAAGYAFAQGYGGYGRYGGMSEIMRSGTYEDLLKYREETGIDVMPWIDDESDFELAQQMHQRMLAWRGANPGAGGCHGARWAY
jgi:ABC-type multidrug transport system fused ATPase/permease subunit